MNGHAATTSTSTTPHAFAGPPARTVHFPGSAMRPTRPRHLVIALSVPAAFCALCLIVFVIASLAGQKTLTESVMAIWKYGIAAATALLSLYFLVHRSLLLAAVAWAYGLVLAWLTLVAGALAIYLLFGTR